MAKKKPAPEDKTLHRFLESQYSEGEKTVKQYAGLIVAQVIAVCRRDGREFYEDVTDPGTDPWFLVACETRFTRRGGSYGRDVGPWVVILATDGEVFYPCKYVSHYEGSTASKTSDQDPRRQRNYDPKLPLAKVSLSYGNVDFKSFGPSDRGLVQRAIAAFAHALSPGHKP